MSIVYIDRPKCCNIGCNKFCANGGRIKGRIIWRPYCQHCHNAGRGIHPYAKGVTPIKKNYCENSDGHLGIDCFSNGALIPSYMLDLDHINGDHHDNSPNNFQTLCKNCHAHKTKFSGDNAKPNTYVKNLIQELYYERY